MAKIKFKQIVSWTWQGIQVWNVVVSLGVPSVIRGIFHNFFNGWAWYDQLFLFGGVFLIILGLLALLVARRENKVIKKDKRVNLAQETSSFLGNVLTFNQQDIYKAVKGRIVKWNFCPLKVAEGPYFEIHFSFVNTSIFTLDLKGLDGTIKVDGVVCFTKPTANVPQNSIIQGQEFYVIITQGVLPEMAKKILMLNDTRPILFDLSQLDLVIETTTKGYEGLKPRIKFENSYTPHVNVWLELQGDKLGYWG